MAELVYPPVITFARAAFRLMGLKISITGTEHIPRTGGAVMAINHVGYLDFAIAGTAALPSKRYVRFMAKKVIFDHRISGPLMRGMKHISVDREAGAASFVAALRALRSGEIIGLFPEATVSRSFELKELKSGAVRLASGSGVPILPTIVWGSQRVWTKGRKPSFKRAHIPITVYVGEPFIVTRDMDQVAAESELRRRLVAMLEEVQKAYPDDYTGQWWAPARLGGTAPTPEKVAEELAEAKRRAQER